MAAEPVNEPSDGPSKESGLWARLRRSRLAGVLLIYLGASWVVVQVANNLTDALSLPVWVSPVSVVLLLVGLVVVVATAWIQSHPLTPQREAAGEVPGDWEVAPGDLAKSVRKGRLPHLTWGRALLLGAIAFSLLFGFAGLYVVVTDRGRSFAPEDAVAAGDAAPAVAALPFDVTGPDTFLAEGLPNLLFTNLDGAGGLRAIDSRTVLARWGEWVRPGAAPDLAAMLDVARVAGARWAVSGRVVSTGSRMRLAADVYDVASGDKLGGAQVEGEGGAGIYALVDALSREILGVLLPRADALRGIDLAAVTTPSFEALKAYLEGEAEYRRLRFEAAESAYERAIAEDSAFALAHFRLSLVHGWAEGISERSGREAAAAARFAERLPRREQLLVRAQHLRSYGLADAIEMLEEASRLFPDDAEVWYELGESYYHNGLQVGAAPAEAERAFGRATALEPAFAVYGLHLFDLAMARADSAAAAARLASYPRTAAGNLHVERQRLAFALAYGGPAERTRAREQSALAIRDIASAANLLAHPVHWPIVEELLRSVPDRDAGAVPASFRLALGSALQVGNLSRALAYLQESERSFARSCGLLEFRWAGLSIPNETEEDLLRGGADDDTDQGGCAAVLAAHRGDFALLEARQARTEERSAASAAEGDSLAQRKAALTLDWLRGYELWARGRPAEAVPLMERGAVGISGPPIQWPLARALLELGRPRDALRYFAALGPDPLAHYEAGKVHEELGNYADSRDAYAFFVSAWEDADPELQPMVEDARRRMTEMAAKVD